MAIFIYQIKHRVENTSPKKRGKRRGKERVFKGSECIIENWLFILHFLRPSKVMVKNIKPIPNIFSIN